MDMMSKGYVYVHICCSDRVGQLGKSGSLGMEWWGEGCAYSEVPRW
jgi:hypothetical protein